MTTGPAGSDGTELFGPLERSGVAKGWLLVAGVVILGAVLMPSATRGALSASAVSAARSGSMAPTSGSTVPVVIATTTTTTATTTLPVTIAPSSIRVLVANGTNTSGAASSVAALLSGKGFATIKAVNALTIVGATQVYPIADAVTAAAEVARALGLAASSVEPNSTPVPVASSAGATVVVVVGPDLLARTSTSAGA